MPRYAVFHLDLDNVRQAKLGEIELDAGGMLHILEAPAPARSRIEKAVNEINGKTELIVKLPPSGEDDGKDSFALRKQEVARTDPRFLDAVQDNLKRWHDMTLVAL